MSTHFATHVCLLCAGVEASTANVPAAKSFPRLSSRLRKLLAARDRCSVFGQLQGSFAEPSAVGLEKRGAVFCESSSVCASASATSSPPAPRTPHHARDAPDHRHRHHTSQKEKGRLDKETGDNMEELARMTKNYSGAEIEGLVKSAASYAFERGVDVKNLDKAPDPKNLVVQWQVFTAACFVRAFAFSF